MFSSIHWFRHWDKIFWLLFAVIGFSLVGGILSGAIQFEFFLVLGLIAVIIGAGKLSEELSDMKVIGYQDDIYKKLNSLTGRMKSSSRNSLPV